MRFAQVVQQGTDYVRELIAMLSWAELVDQAKTEGFSVQLMTGDIPVTGYMVALEGHEERIPVGAFTTERLTRYVKAHFEALAEGDTYLGAWLDGDTVYLDVSECISDRALAIVVATERKQLAVWDVLNSAEINTTSVGV